MSDQFKFSTELSLEKIREMQAKFAAERGWGKFRSPRNLLLGTVGEVGKVSEIFQWKGEVEAGLPDWPTSEKVHLGEELSDMLIYLVRLAEVCHIDLPSAVLRKMELNGEKYPVDVAFGSSLKYNEHKSKMDEK